MLDTGSRQGGFTEHLPFVVNAVLVAALAYWVTLVVSEYLEPQKVTVSAAPPVAAPAVPRADAAGVREASRIAAWHVFGEPVKQQEEAPEQFENAPESKLEWILRGIVSSDRVASQLAIIQDRKQRRERHFAIGSTVFGLARLEAIYPDRVIVSRNGRFETLTLPEERVAGVATEEKRPSSRVAQQMSSEDYVAFMTGQMKEIHKETLASERNPWRYVYYEPAMTADGRIVGLKLTAEEERQFLEGHGLELGDTITSINGVELDVGGGLVKALDLISESDRLRFEVERNGSRKIIEVDNNR